MKISKIFSAVMAGLMSVVMLALPVNADEGYDDGNPVFALDKAQTYTVEAGKKNEIIFFIKNIAIFLQWSINYFFKFHLLFL